jgi:CHAT domain-containing protein/tetratricopeptide (TPR) repeat protein
MLFRLVVDVLAVLAALYVLGLARARAPRTLLLALLLLGCRGKAPFCVGSPTLRIAVQPGDDVHAVADQGPRDVALTLFDSRGRQLLKVDSLTAETEPRLPAEEIHWVADAPGELRIELSLLDGPRDRPCALRLAEHRRATAMDLQRALAEADLARAHELRRTKEPKACRSGVAPYESAERGFAGLGLPRRQGEALLGLGQLQRECLDDNAAALKAFTRAEPLFAGAPAFEVKVRLNLGELRYFLGDLDGAINEDRHALALSQQLGDRVQEAQAASNLGFPLHLLGRYDEAATYFDRALGLWRPGDDADKWAITLLNRGHLDRQLGETDRARDDFNKALALFRQAKDRNLEAATLNALGLLALDTGRPGEALEPLRAALSLRPSGSRGRAVTQATLGIAYRQLGRLAEARQADEEALPIFRNLGAAREQAGCLGNLGLLEATAGRDAAALDYFDSALEMFRRLADPPHLAWTLEGKARVLRRHGDLEAARGLTEEALAAIERHRFIQTSYTTRADFFSTQQGSYDFLIDLLMEMHQKAPTAGYDAAALEINERSLARSLLDGLAASGADFHYGGADPRLQAREREVEKEIDALVSFQTRQEAAAPEQLRSVEQDLGRHWDELDRVRAELRISDPRYAALTQPQPWKAAEIQHGLLGPDTLLLEYRLGETRSFLWAVTSESLKSFVLPGRAEIERAACPACDLLGLLARSYGRSAEISAGLQLAMLSRLLLSPVAPLLPGKKRLLVVGDGILQSLPFAAFLEPGGSEPLIARHEIIALPSVSVLGEIRREIAARSRAPKALWVLAAPDFGASRAFKPLPYTRDESAAILALVPASDSVEVQGREASREEVLRAPLRDYRILHFATHGSFGATEPGGGRLVLAQVDPQGRPEPNGFLHLADIYELSLRANLVVLSACESALGREVRGEGMMGMTRGFFYAGAERVLVSLWNVSDGRATVELMRHFYRGILKEGLSPAAALQKAQSWVRQQEGWRAPYYWAGFTLQGEWK